MGSEMTERELRDRELHHFETEQENERLKRELYMARQKLEGYKVERALLQHQLAQPPAGWFTFGSHVDQDVRLEFWGDDHGVPIWERPRG